MAKIVIVGAGFSGHTAALYLSEWLRKDDGVTVISASDKFIYHPLLVDVAAGRIPADKISFHLSSIYEKRKINFIKGKVVSVLPDENKVEFARENGTNEKIDYDFLLIATGNKPSFEATKGFETNGETFGTMISLNEIEKTRSVLDELIARMKKGEKKKIVVGSGHPQSTYHNASIGFLANLHFRLLKENVRDKAELVYLSNEKRLGDFGLRNPRIKRSGKIISSGDVIKKILDEINVEAITGKGVREISENKVYWENIDGEFGETDFDFAVLTPKTKGQALKFIDKNGKDISYKLVNDDNYLLVDTFYGLTYKEVFENPDYLPSMYRNRNFKNIFAGGFAFALPSTISEPVLTKNGTNITPAPMISSTVSATIGRLIAKNISQYVREERMTHALRLSEMLSLFTVQLGGGKFTGDALLSVIYPVFPDIRKYPKEDGRDLFVSEMEVGYAAYWMRKIIHGSYIYKYKNKPGWKIIPE